jgi:hypothetical protein
MVNLQGLNSNNLVYDRCGLCNTVHPKLRGQDNDVETAQETLHNAKEDVYPATNW